MEEEWKTNGGQMEETCKTDHFTAELNWICWIWDVFATMSAHINIGVINMGKVLDIGAEACELLINSCSQTGID